MGDAFLPYSRLWRLSVSLWIVFYFLNCQSAAHGLHERLNGERTASHTPSQDDARDNRKGGDDVLLTYNRRHRINEHHLTGYRDEQRTLPSLIRGFRHSDGSLGGRSKWQEEQRGFRKKSSRKSDAGKNLSVRKPQQEQRKKKKKKRNKIGIGESIGDRMSPSGRSYSETSDAKRPNVSPTVPKNVNRFSMEEKYAQESLRGGTASAQKLIREQRRPNIVLIITDDLDVELGSLNYMPRLLRILGDGGAFFPNSFTSTPMCCPSRSSLLTGMYVHNHEIYTNHMNCSGPHWQNTHEPRSFGAYLDKAGYQTGYFGKYLNRYNGSYVPSGWREWGGLKTNSKYYNYTVNRNGQKVKYGSRYPQDYYPHVITNDGLNFLRESHAQGDTDPFLLVLSYPAPHGPEDSAPEHSHRFFNASDHHTASYNYAPNPDKQWLLQFTDRMPDIQKKFTDLLMTKRLQTLQTIDESIEKIVNELEALKLVDTTYVFFTSDHGYHLGQFGLAKGKSLPFEFDIKVPFLVRGPSIQPGIKISNIALNIDLAPTLLDIAGVSRPSHMDGRSLLPVLNDSQHTPWRHSFIVESSGRLREEEELEKKELRMWQREKAISKHLHEGRRMPFYSNASLNAQSIKLYTSKHERFEEVCRRLEFTSPCKELQKWHCVKSGNRWRIKKCRPKMQVWQKHCICQSPHGFGTYHKLDSKERRKQTRFLKKYLNKNIRLMDRRFIKTFSNIELPNIYSDNYYPPPKVRKKGKRLRRRFPRSLDGTKDTPSEANSTDNLSNDQTDKTFSPVHSIKLNLDESLIDSNVQAFVKEEELRDLEDHIHEITDEINILQNVTNIPLSTYPFNHSSDSTQESATHHGCHASEGRIGCREDVYENYQTWISSKLLIEDQIRRLRQQLAIMKNIHRHLQSKKPESLDSLHLDNGNLYDVAGSEEDLKGTTADLNGTLPEGYSFKTETENSPLLKLDNDSNFPSGRSPPKENEEEADSTALYPIPMSSLLDEFSVLKNEAAEPMCWCDKRIARRLEIQQERAIKREERQKIKDYRQRRKRRQRKKGKVSSSCQFRTLNCYTHTNDHWKTPPLWTDGEFCFCINAPNNTYWCLRTINDTHNFLYCEFITGLITYYDLHIDPYELRNVAFTLPNEELVELHKKLQNLRVCKGADQCDGIASIADREILTPKQDGINTTNGKSLIYSPNPFPDHFINAANKKRKIRKLKMRKFKERQKKKKLRKERKKMMNYFEGSLLEAPELYLSAESFSQRVRLPRKSRREHKQRKHRRMKNKKRDKRKRIEKNNGFKKYFL